MSVTQLEGRPGAGEEWRATTKHDGAEVESILIDKTGVGQALRQDWSANENLANQFSTHPGYHLFKLIRDKRGVGAEGLKGMRRNPLRLAPVRRREGAIVRVPIRKIF